MQSDLVASSIADPQPWIGSAYLRQPIRVLVVGESHKMSDGSPAPTEGADLREQTVHAVMGRIVRGDDFKFWSNVEQALAERPDRLDMRDDGQAEIMARSDFWHSISFANFFARVMESQNDRPKRDDYKPATQRLAALINALAPDLACVFSAEGFNNRPWGEAPAYDGFYNLPVDDGSIARLTRYQRPDGGFTLLAGFNHASRAGFRAARLRYTALRSGGSPG